jgi:hypothetical protein
MIDGDDFLKKDEASRVYQQTYIDKDRVIINIILINILKVLLKIAMGSII